MKGLLKERKTSPCLQSNLGNRRTVHRKTRIKQKYQEPNASNMKSPRARKKKRMPRSPRMPQRWVALLPRHTTRTCPASGFPEPCTLSWDLHPQLWPYTAAVLYWEMKSSQLHNSLSSGPFPCSRAERQSVVLNGVGPTGRPTIGSRKMRASRRKRIASADLEREGARVPALRSQGTPTWKIWFCCFTARLSEEVVWL